MEENILIQDDLIIISNYKSVPSNHMRCSFEHHDGGHGSRDLQRIS